MGEQPGGDRPGGAGDMAPPKRVRLCWTKRRKRQFLTRLAETYDMGAARAAVTGLGQARGWKVVTLVPLRCRIASEGRRRWIARTDYRARMLAS
jgi:hypothetical protein